MKRIPSLLSKAADAFSDGSDPFSLYWLEENKVTLDEAIIMQEFISQAIKGALIKIEVK